jgi:hypothetical protein
MMDLSAGNEDVHIKKLFRVSISVLAFKKTVETHA